MKNLILLTGIFLVFIMNAYSQVGDSTIKFQRGKYYQNNKIIKYHELETILAYNSTSASELQKYNADIIISIPFVIVGAYYIITGTLNRKRELNVITFQEKSIFDYKKLLIGAACEVGGLSFALVANKHLKKSVSLYNSSLKDVGYKQVQANFMVNSNGLGISVVF